MKWFDRKLLRPLAYSSFLVLGLSAAFDQLENGYQDNFFNLIFVISLILVIEIFTTWSFYQLSRQQIVINTSFSYERWLHWMHHLVLPVIAFYASAWFIYYNEQRSIRWILYGATLATFTLLFYNLRSYFEHNQLGEKLSHYVYDLLKFYMVFLITDVAAEAFDGQSRLLVVPVINIFIISIFSILSIGRRQQFTPANSLLSLIIGVIVGAAAFVFIGIFNLAAINLALTVLLTYYFCNASFHHYLDKSLRLNILFEYAVVLVLVLVILINLG